MAISQHRIKQPGGGINNSEPRFAIGEDQALELRNMRPNGSVGLESIRPPHRLASSIGFAIGAEHITDDLLVFRRRVGNPLWMFAHGGEVYASTSAAGTPIGIGFNGDPSARIHMFQFNEQVFIFNGVSANKKYDGVNLYDSGITAPDTALVQGGPTTPNLTRVYYYTYYNSNDTTESDPSPVLTSDTFDGLTSTVTAVPSTDPQVDKIRIYRTGVGIVTPRLAATIANTATPYTDISVDADVAAAKALHFNHAKPPILANTRRHNNRVFGWGGVDTDTLPNNDTLWVSNEYNPQYMPIVPFIDSDDPTSGGPIRINPGDGGRIMGFVPWGGSGIVFKDTAVYRIQETEVGFYSYQPMNLPPCIAERSIQLTANGVVWLSPDGWMLLTYEEQTINFGYYIREIIDQIEDFDLVSSGVSRDYYITSFKKINGEWATLTFYNNAWQGEHTEVIGSSYFVDKDGQLYAGRVSNGAGINRLAIHDVGYAPGQQSHTANTISWVDGAREYNVGSLSRIRKVRVEGRVLTHDSYQQPLYLNVYNEFGELLTSEPFSLPIDGAIDVWLSYDAMGQYLSVAIEGTITRAIRLVAMTPVVERVGVI